MQRFNRSLKERLWKHFTKTGTKKWLTILPQIVKDLNRSQNRTIGMRPIDVTRENEVRREMGNSFSAQCPILQKEVWKKKYGNSLELYDGFKFNMGEKVRVKLEKGVFGKGYTPTYSQELFTIVKRIPRSWPVYEIIGEGGDAIVGKWYENELIKAE